MRRAAAASGILGPIFLVIYFAAPAVTGWPYSGASPERLISYATAHAWLFYAGAWFQVTGTLLSLAFYLALLHAPGARAGFWGSFLLLTGGSLLAVVLVEAAFLVAVPIAASAGDKATVATSFALSNGVFVRVFPLAPASGTFIALGAILFERPVLPPVFAAAAIGLGAAFELAGLLAIVSSIGLFALIGLSVIQTLWTVAAAVAFATYATPQAASGAAVRS
jgi:hypothetical protein